MSSNSVPSEDQKLHITVLLSVRNSEDTIIAAIESIRHQTYSNWDLIVIDDASTDQTPIILDKIKKIESRVSVIRNEVSHGLASALNKGLKVARGPLIARMDGDDISLPKRLELQEKFLRENRDIEIVGSQAYSLNQYGEVTGIVTRPTTHKELVSGIWDSNPFIHPSVCARKSFFEKYSGYRESCRFAQDMDLWMRSHLNSKFHNLPDYLLIYRSRELTFKRVYWGIRVKLLYGIRNQNLMTALRASFRLLVFYYVRKFKSILATFSSKVSSSLGITKIPQSNISRNSLYKINLGAS